MRVLRRLKRSARKTGAGRELLCRERMIVHRAPPYRGFSDGSRHTIRRFRFSWLHSRAHPAVPKINGPDHTLLR